MKITTEQAAKLAQQIRERFGLKIAKAVDGTPIPAKFVAGLISVEAGKDKHGQISETATRFEAGVFGKLQQVRDGKRSQWSGIKLADIGDSPDLALRALATSYGLTQVMGWHCIHNLDCTVADLRDPAQHLKYAVKLLLLNSADGDFERREYVGEFREWNSGNEKGKTYDPDYVFNAGSVMDAYAELETETPFDPVEIRDQLIEPAPVPATQTPPVETVASRPPVVEVKNQSASTGTKIAAAISAITPFVTATGLKIGGVEFSTGALYAVAAIIIVGLIVGAIIYDRGQQRAWERQKLGMNNLADPNKGNVVAGSGS